MDEQAKKDRDQKNADFIQFYRRSLDFVADLSTHPAALRLFMFIVKHMDGSNALCVSMNALQECLGISRQSISTSIKYLKDNGYLCVFKSGTSNVYVINPDIAWTSYGYQKQYCKFNATVFLAGTENAEYLNNPKAFEKVKTVSEDFIKTVQNNHREQEQFAEHLNQAEG